MAGTGTQAGKGTQGTNKPAYTVVPTKTPPTIDGKIDDAVWQSAKFTELYAFVPLTEQKKTKADPATTFALSADNKNLYVAFRCMDPEMGKLKKIATERDGKVKGSLRTLKEEVNVADIAASYGGGGHTKAAGFSIPGRLEQEIRWKVVS